MKFIIKGDAEKIYENLEEFITEAEKQWESETKRVLKKLKPKLSVLPVKPNLDFPPLTLAETLVDENTVYLFSNLGGNSEGVTGKLFQTLYKPAKKKMLKNLKGFLESRGLEVDIIIEDV
jgi:hypothetical protein